MSAPRSRRRARLSALVSAAVVLAGAQLLLTPSAQANPAGTGLVISEAYGGGGNAGATLKNDFIELYNPTASPISVAGLSVQYRSSGGTTAASGVTVLGSGSVPAHGHYLVQEAAGTGGTANLPTPDVTGTIAMSGTAFTVFLANATTAINPGTGSVVSNPQVIDLVGSGSNTFEGTVAAGVSNTTSVSRAAAGTDTDNNAADFTTQAPDPQNAGSSSAALALTDPGPQASTVGNPIPTLQLAASGGSGTYTFSATGLPPGLDISASGAVTGTPTTATGSPFSVQATVSDGSTSASVTFTWTVNAVQAVTEIKDIQGTGATSPLAGQTVTTQGVVTASYPTGGLNGFYLQTPGPDTANASDAIFVFGGSGGFASYPAIGDSVKVTGTVSEFSGLTELSATSFTPVADLGTVTPKSQVPGTGCALPGTGCLTGAALDAAREVTEGELFQPTAPWTATDVYDGRPLYNDGSTGSSNFGEIGVAAESSDPLIAPTELYDAQTEGTQIAQRKAYNDAHRIVLDDGSSTNYSTATGQPFPWLTATYTTRVGASVSFPAPVVLTYGFGTWRLEPTSQVVGAPSATQPQFSQTRAQNQTPQDVGGDLRLATFNVLNFFPTTGEEYVASGLGACTYFTDRAGNRVTTNSCGSPSTSSGNGPRGAADDANLTRQRDKIVAAINASTADVVSLEELENSVKFGKSRDFAISQLVGALNSAAGAGTWDYVPSPPASGLPALADQDVIRTGFIYRPATVALVGTSQVLADQSSGTGVFANAREPLAQAFKKVGAPSSSAFLVVVNHFKSKGSGVDDGTGQGNSNPDRVAQANAMTAWADQVRAGLGISRVFLVGDFNAYSHEDPVQAIEAAGYAEQPSTTDPSEETYNFDGQAGSLDHVFANPAAAADVSGADVWRINADEPVYYEYSRYNYDVTDLYLSGPFRSSDHNPEIVGIDVASAKVPTTTSAADATATQGSDATVDVTVAATSGSAVPTGTVTITAADGTVLGSGTLAADGTVTVTADTSALGAGTSTLTATYGGDADFDVSSDQLTLTVTSGVKQIQILATNDFHGRIQNDPTSAAAGAGILAGAVKQLRAQNPDTVFAAAGDLIGASTFESFIAKDKPTIDALNSAGLEVSSVGNHEFDQGYDDLVNRVMAPYDAQTNPYGGAQWKYLGANVKLKDGSDALDGTWMKDVDGVQVGFIGAVTEHLPELVSPAGISTIDVTDVVSATNSAADDLKAAGADVVVLLVHEGASSTNCATMDADPTSDFGSIITGVNDNVDAIVSGHTHLAYNCSFAVPGWAGRPVTQRPVVSAGQYGSNLNQLVFDVDSASGTVESQSQQILALKAGQTANYPVDQPTQQIVDAAVANANVLGAQPLGAVAAPFKRGYLADGTTENRGAESTLGNLVAEVQRWATSSSTSGAAQIAFMNPGGLRADILGSGSGSSRTVTYKEAATVQPFANTLVNMTLTGAQVKQVLEQQWQPSGASRPFLKLGISQGLTYTYDPTAPAGNRITEIWLNGTPLTAAATYSVTVNSFLASGGDNFTAFNGGTGKRDTGKTDLQAMVDYLATFADPGAGDPPLPVDYSQRAVGVTFPAGAPTTYPAGTHVVFDVSSFSMTNATDVKDARIRVERNGAVVTTVPLDNTPQSSLPGQDVAGRASVDVVVPDGLTGSMTLDLVGVQTGTRSSVTVQVSKRATAVSAPDVSIAWGALAKIPVTVTGGARTPSGTVQALDGTTVVATGTLNAKTGKVVLTVPARTLLPGQHALDLVYSGDAVYAGSHGTSTVSVAKATPVLKPTAVTFPFGAAYDVRVTLSGATGLSPGGTVTISENGAPLGSATMVNGVAVVTLPAQSLAPGSHALDVSYSGDASVNAATSTLTATVQKATATVAAVVSPAQPRVFDPVQVSVVVTGSNGVQPDGDVQVSVNGGQPVVAALVNGSVVFDLGSFSTTGKRTVVVQYLGSAEVGAAKRTVAFTVRP